MRNQRNFYRVLHVQPEAPPEIITASYRSLMTKLRVHPDLGGDHETAALVNQAYSVLSDPGKRREYDAELRASRPLSMTWPAQAPARTQPGEDSDVARQPVATGDAVSRRTLVYTYTECPFCGASLDGPHARSARCARCDSPITLDFADAPVPVVEQFGRRAAPRLTAAAAVTLYPNWPHPGYAARLRDLSSTGVSLLADYRPGLAQILKFEARLASGIAQVVSFNTTASGAVAIHASLLTVALEIRSGTFLSERA